MTKRKAEKVMDLMAALKKSLDKHPRPMTTQLPRCANCGEPGAHYIMPLGDQSGRFACPPSFTGTVIEVGNLIPGEPAFMQGVRVPNDWPVGQRVQVSKLAALKEGSGRGTGELADSNPPAVPPHVRNLIANDAFAIQFQTLGQYRTALLRLCDDPAFTPPGGSA